MVRYPDWYPDGALGRSVKLRLKCIYLGKVDDLPAVRTNGVNQHRWRARTKPERLDAATREGGSRLKGL